MTTMSMRVALMGGAALVLAACGERASADKGDAPRATAGSAQAIQAGSGPASETRTFRDWMVTCDNGNACVAFAPGAEGTAFIRVALDAGPDAKPTMAVGLWTETGDGTAVPITLTIDGARFIAAQEMEDASGETLREPAGAVAALANSRAISLSASGETVAVSTAGSAAALLWIDERQGRLDTVTALVRKGTKPASAVPAPPALPVVTAAPAVSQVGFGDFDQTLPAAVEATDAAKECRGETEGTAVEDDVSSARLDATTELWGMACFNGAYNTGMRYFLTGPGGSNPRVVHFPSTGEASDTLTNAAYSPSDRTLSEFNKGRGLADCGVATTWTWTGREFVLTEESKMTECWSMGPDLWPTTWRTR